jgi:hypothetical protein
MGEQFSLEPQLGEQLEQAPAPIRVEDWALENQHETLLSFIRSSDQTNRNIGILREDMFYDPVAKTMTLTLNMRPELHRGHTINGEYEAMIGGMPKAFADVVSGALAFTAIPANTVPLHTTITGSKMGTMILQHEAPIVVTSSFVEDSEGKKLAIKTVVSQGPNTCFTEVCNVRVAAENMVGQMAERVKSGLDTWIQQQER